MIRSKTSRTIWFLVIAVLVGMLLFFHSAEAHGNGSEQQKEGTAAVLTEEERGYVKAHPVVSIAIDTSWAPYGFERKEGGCGGIIPNVMNLVAERAGLKVEFISAGTYKDAIDSCTSGRTMLVSGIADDPRMAETNQVLLTDPYITIGYSAVTRKELSDLYAEGADYRVALCVGTYAKMAMQAKMPSYEFVEYHTNQECMDAVLDGKADIALVANYSAGYFSSWHQYSRLQTIQINDFDRGLCFGVNRDMDPMLIDILNKSIATISENDLNQAIYTGATEAATSVYHISDVLYEQPLLVAGAAGILVAMLALMLFLLNSQKRRDRELANEASRRELQESADVVEAALHNADVAIWSYDIGTHSITQQTASKNRPEFGKIVERVPESLIECGYVHPDFAESYRKLFDSLKEAVGSYQGEFMVRDQSENGYKWERVIMAPRYENGRLTGAIGTSINITAWKEKVSQYQKHVDDMTEAGEENLIAKGRYNLTDNQILYYSRQSAESLHLDSDVTFDFALEQMARTAVSADDARHMKQILNRRQLLQNYAVGKTGGTLEYKRNQEEGTAFWSLLKYFMFEEPNSGDIIFFVYTYDISERVREERMLARLGATEYDVLGLIDVKTHHFESRSIKGVKSLASAGNQYAKGLFEDIVHNQILATVQESRIPELEQQLTIDAVVEALKTQEVYSVAFSAVRKSKSRRRKQMNFSYLDETKTTIFYYCTDITETYEREQEQLSVTEKALDAARAASESKTEFFSRMSHDMRTPMNGILGLAELSEDETDPKVLKENIEKIQDSGRYLLGLINDTLDFQKIESGKLRIEPQVVQVSSLLDNITSMIRTTAEEKGVEFQVLRECLDETAYIRVDPLRMKQIFVNLLSNAVKFTPPGGTVQFAFHRLGLEEPVSHQCITVSDTGIGMSKEFLENGIFRPFSQERNAVTSNYAGTGLGLSIAKQLVELMGGTITVESEQGVGTTFSVHMDVERVDAGAYERETRISEEHQSNVTGTLQGLRILLAEDHPLNAEIARKLLQKVGCQVTWAKNGQECVDAVKASAGQESGEPEYDLILMDIRMPVMDGLEAARAIRSISDPESLAKIPIIAMTANAYAEDVERCLAAGMNAHIAKPIEPMVMYETIAEVIYRSKSVGTS